MIAQGWFQRRYVQIPATKPATIPHVPPIVLMASITKKEPSKKSTLKKSSTSNQFPRKPSKQNKAHMDTLVEIFLTSMRKIPIFKYPNRGMNPKRS